MHVLEMLIIFIMHLGTPSMVRYLNFTIHDDIIFLNWTAPVPLGISSLDRNITYCVTVVNITTPAEPLSSECGINVTEYTYQLPPHAGCSSTMFKVAPVNMIGSGKMSSQTFRPEDGMFAMLSTTFVGAFVVLYSP